MQGPLSSESVCEAAVRGEATALKVFTETGEYLGIACANLINLLNLEMIIVGGGVMASGDLLLETARATAKLYAFPSSFAGCRIVNRNYGQMPASSAPRCWPVIGSVL
jgi:glucokinase